MPHIALDFSSHPLPPPLKFALPRPHRAIQYPITHSNPVSQEQETHMDGGHLAEEEAAAAAALQLDRGAVVTDYGVEAGVDVSP